MSVVFDGRDGMPEFGEITFGRPEGATGSELTWVATNSTAGLCCVIMLVPTFRLVAESVEIGGGGGLISGVGAGVDTVVPGTIGLVESIPAGAADVPLVTVGAPVTVGTS